MENDNLKNESNVLYTLLAAVDSVVGKIVRVIKEDKWTMLVILLMNLGGT